MPAGLRPIGGRAEPTAGAVGTMSTVRSNLMPRLVDTTLRLLGQEPLAGRLPTSDQFRLAEILDGAGFAYLEVSGGGCFDTAVKRGVESPWERIRALRTRTETPLAMALRGRFLVGSRPVGVDVVRRFVACAADSGIDVFRLHDPLNDVSNLREAAEAITAADREFDAGLVYSPGPHGETEAIAEQARRLPELGAARVLIHDPSGSLNPRIAAELVAAVRDASGLPVGLYCQGAGGAALAAALEAVRAGADLIATALYPLALSLHRLRASRSRARSASSTSTPASTSTRSGARRSSSTSSSATSPSRRSRRASPHALPSTACRRGSSPHSTCTCGPTPPATGSTRCSMSSR